MGETKDSETPSPNASSTIDARSLVPRVPSALKSSAYVLVFEGDSTRMVPLPSDGDFVIGRGDTADLKIEGNRVSRNHARITMLAGQGRLCDLGSQNGTLLNDAPVVGQRVLNSGDIVSVAGVLLVFHTSTRGSRQPGFVDAATFRSRAEIELDRSTRFSRPLAVLEINLNSMADRPRVQMALETVLRQVDLATWTSNDRLSILAPEADEDEGRLLAEQTLEVLAGLYPRASVGLAICPHDGVDPETLGASARAAVAVAKPEGVALASETFRSLAVGERSVIVADASMLRLYDLIERLAKSELVVLIQGETGTGKELVASAIHTFSPRVSKRFLTVNCAALQESLLESELFGHERGAFTGATASKIGLLESAPGGTIFLDEIGEMSPSLQAKLLRALESKKITRVGDTKEREIDIRIVAATHRDLQKAVKEGAFREDLYFRIAGATVWIPPLHDRRREIPLLARKFLEAACQASQRAVPVLTPDAISRLAAYAWPGNVRELKNVIDFLAATVADPLIDAWHVESRLGSTHGPSQIATAATSNGERGVLGAGHASGPDLSFRAIGDEIRELEQKRMLEALRVTAWNQTRAASVIQMPLRTFVTKFKQFDLTRFR